MKTFHISYMTWRIRTLKQLCSVKLKSLPLLVYEAQRSRRDTLQVTDVMWPGFHSIRSAVIEKTE